MKQFKKEIIESKSTYKFIISGGGTGGHIYPAIAIANELKKRFPGAEFLFVGASDRMEMEKVPKAGYKIEGLWIAGLQRNLSLKNLMFPFKLLSSLFRSYAIISKFKPDVAIGTGGYASAPLLKVASMRSVPCVIQEQNSHAGITNKWLSASVDTICTAYSEMDTFFPSEKIVLTGNPVRQDLLEIGSKRLSGQTYFNLSSSKKTLLVLGGSLGARKINETIKAALPFFEKNDVQVIWQCGSYYIKEYENYQKGNTQLHAFLDRMDLAYAAADIIVSRAGALSVSELCIVGKPVIFIPSPNVAEDHQTKNALSIVEQNAALMLKETELEEKFESEISRVLTNEALCHTLSGNIKALARPNATIAITDEIVKLIKQKEE